MIEWEGHNKGGLGVKIFYYFAIAISLFHIWVNVFGLLSELWRNALHLTLLGSLCFLTYPLYKKKSFAKGIYIDIAFVILLVTTGLYLILAEDALHARNEEVILSDLIFAGICILLVIELSRRTSGLVIPVLVILVLTYALFWGSWLNEESMFYFPGAKVSLLFYRMYFTDEGLFSTTASISSTFVFMFMLFAAFLLKSGGGDFIINIAQALTRKVTGGSGIIAVLSSGLMGTISGSAIANTVSTGSVTIPMMKRAGFSPQFSAGVETAASTGGQIMPPIMGAGAFIMAEYTRVPYTTIIGVAFLPAVLYFATVGFFVYQEAKKHGLKADDTLSNVPLRSILREGIHFFIPIGVLIVMLILRFTPSYAAGYSILAVIAASYLSKHHKMSFTDILDSLALGAKNMITTGVLLVAVGLVIGTVTMTGVSITFSQMIVALSGGQLLMAIIFIMLASLLLGMGLPVTAAYIMLAILAAPALKDMGVTLLTAHMIIFWVSQDSNVTPPVCLAAFAAAGIAGASPMATGFQSWKLAKGLYIIPFLFAYTGLIGGDILSMFSVFAFALFGFYSFASVFSGYFGGLVGVFERVILIFVSFALFYPDIYYRLLGLFSFLLLFFITRRRNLSLNSS